MGVGTLQPVKGTYDSEVQDTVTIEIDYTHPTLITTATGIIDVINEASNPLLTTGTVVPKRRARFGTTNLLAREFSVEQNDQIRTRFKFTVTYKKPEQLGPAMAAVMELHPIFWPKSVHLERLDKEYVVDRAYNVEALKDRPANTYGPVTNSVGVEAEFPLVDTSSQGVIVVRRNVSAASVALGLNEAFDLTTNSNTQVVDGKSYAPRQLKYLCTESSDEMEFDDLPYFQIETRIGIEKTTDRSVNSVGYRAYSAGGKLTEITLDADGFLNTNGSGNVISEPAPILHNGQLGLASSIVPITYYYREPVSYSSLFS